MAGLSQGQILRSACLPSERIPVPPLTAQFHLGGRPITCLPPRSPTPDNAPPRNCDPPLARLPPERNSSDESRKIHFATKQLPRNRIRVCRLTGRTYGATAAALGSVTIKSICFS